MVCSPTYHDGFILVVVMFFLFILSLLCLGSLNLIVFEGKINRLYYNKIQSFYYVEAMLLKAESKLLRGEKNYDPKIISILYRDDINKLTFYRLDLRTEYHGAVSAIQSVVAVPDELYAHSTKDGSLYGRQSFVVKN